jgi:hypothetical protein
MANDAANTPKAPTNHAEADQLRPASLASQAVYAWRSPSRASVFMLFLNLKPHEPSIATASLRIAEGS